MTDLQKLLERVKAAAEPDRELDADIAKCFKLGWDYGAEWPTIEVDGRKDSEPTARQFTASIDVAASLMALQSPGCGWSICHYEGSVPTVFLHCADGEIVHSHAPTPPLAILAASLSALIAQASP